MNRTILKKTRQWTLLAAVVIALVLGFTVSLNFATGFLVTAVWSVASFWVLERLLCVAVIPPGSHRNKWAAAGWLGAKLALYGLAAWAVFQRPFPALSHVLGLTLLLVVLVVAGTVAQRDDRDQPTP